MQGNAGAIAKYVTTEFQRQERLLEEAKRDLVETRRDLEMYKSATERDRNGLEERFEQETRALKDEIRQLKGRDMHGWEDIFERERRALNHGILRLEVESFPHISDAKHSVFWVSLPRLLSRETVALTAMSFLFSN